MSERIEFPFTAIVGQSELRLALVLNAIDSGIGGVAVMGERGTGKSTAVRALAQVLPPIDAVAGCPFHCDPTEQAVQCDVCRARHAVAPVGLMVVPVVDLPLGCTEDRLLGSLDLEAALLRGVKRFSPGLLAAANRGFLYIDEVNLLEDHLVDALLDVAASGVNRVEREGLSVRHPARFVLVGSGNPEEGELRPQLLDRFGLYVTIEPLTDPASRAEIVRRRLAFSADPAAVCAVWRPAEERLRQKIQAARDLLSPARGTHRAGGGRRRPLADRLPDPLLEAISRLCSELAVAGHRGELTLARAAVALAAFEGRETAEAGDAARVAAMALRHRLHRDPLEPVGVAAALGEAVCAHLGPEAVSDALFAEPIRV